uniref:Subtilisin-like protease fibronectin type-III domain-containing protein n=1 Tax=Gossypium raimondii TaxID=29730 RepID=A0A0D2RSB6_GOSRA|nr:hypothetical protein B456_004G025300 [Gossypium raimondii]
MKASGLGWAVLLVLLGLVVKGKAEIYIVTVEGEPIISYKGGENGFEATAVESDEKLDTTSELVTSYASHLEKKHDMLLGMLFEHGSYKKLYSYKHLINGFSVHLSPQQAETLKRAPGVKSVERDWKVRKLTTHTPQFLGLPTGVWPAGGGFDRAGEDIVIGFVDSGIYPHHPSFAAHHDDPYGPVPKYRGKCEIDPDTKRDFCNGKIIGAQYFAEAAKAAGAFNPTIDFASPMDGDGHGSHTAAIAAGNNGIPVRLHGHEFGKAMENVSPGTKFDPVPVGIPGILITDVSKTMDLIDYYNVSTPRDWTGRVKSFKAIGSIGDGLMPILHKSAPEVALFSARGPNIRDFSFQDADLLKPDILAPGSLIWAAWSPNGTDEPNFVGEGFALISGTSMAAPHIAGIAALLKQKHPQWSPAAIKSALMTTSTKLDRAGRPLQAQQYSETEAMKLVPATPFDYGSGHVNPRAALDPGLIFDAGYEDYVGFLCTTPGIDIHEIKKYTNSPCNSTIGRPSNLNTPSITISHLVGTQTVTRTVTNVAEEETYVITARMHPSVAIETRPSAMTLRPGASRKFSVTLTARSVTGSYCFGEITMKGSRGHKVTIPVVAMGHWR